MPRPDTMQEHNKLRTIYIRLCVQGLKEYIQMKLSNKQTKNHWPCFQFMLFHKLTKSSHNSLIRQGRIY